MAPFETRVLRFRVTKFNDRDFYEERDRFGVARVEWDRVDGVEAWRPADE